MSALAYNISLLIGLLLIGAGVALQFNIGAAAIVVGVLVIGLTVFGSWLSRGKN